MRLINRIAAVYIIHEDKYVDTSMSNLIKKTCSKLFKNKVNF